MAKNQIEKLVWIVDTIRKARKITFEELNEKWIDDDDFSGGLEMLKRTFHKWKEKINYEFGIQIECEPIAPYQYYIANDEILKDGSVESWLLNTYSICNSMAESKAIKDRILLENIPSGRDHLQPIIEAMKRNRFIHIKYYSYSSNAESDRYVMPLCIKLFRQRWYMVGRTWPGQRDAIFCLDRIREFRMGSRTFEYPADFSPEEYFDGTFGIINDENVKVETVKLKVSAQQANYLRDLPLHPSQVEVERGEEHSIFTVRVRPTFDFQQELLWNRDELEVLEPQWLRKEIAGVIKRMSQTYSAKKTTR